MIALNQILFKSGTVSKMIDSERFKEETDSSILRYVKRDLAVLFWNTTFVCNLKCIHCYASATPHPHPNELKREEMIDVIDDLSNMKLPVIIFSGGEPLMNPYIYELSEIATEKGIRSTLSTNGTLIDENVAGKIKDSGFKYVGISLDGMREKHDFMRGVKGAFDRSINGLKNIKNVGIMSGVRFTVTKNNYDDLPKLFDLSLDIGIDRFCVYHLVPSGRGANVEDIDNKKRREMLDFLIEKTYYVHDEKIEMEILTVDNPVDGVYAFLKTLKEDEKRAREVYRLLKRRGGDNSGIKAGNIDPLGYVHPNQFWWDLNMGNVRERKFSEIWRDGNEIVNDLRKNKTVKLKGKCARCNFKDICGGFRLRALRINGDLWAEDPDCYLTEDEIKTPIPEEWVEKNG